MQSIRIVVLFCFLVISSFISIAQSEGNNSDKKVTGLNLEPESERFEIPSKIKVSKKVKKALSKEFEGFSKIPESQFIVQYGAKMTFTPLDSHTLAGARTEEILITQKEFFMNTHEVTNKEYRAFLEFHKARMQAAGEYDFSIVNHPVWYTSIDSTGLSNKLNLCVNNELWVIEFNLSAAEQLSELYFTHPVFENYPVVGISYEQCLAFIEWKNQQITRKLKSVGFNEKWGSIKMPTREEWLCAAGGLANSMGVNPHQMVRAIYPWYGHTLFNQETGSFYANLGRIIDQNGLLVNSMVDDGYLYTAPIKSYNHNDFGLYDMGGNVSEWTATTINSDSLKKIYDEFYSIDCFKGDTVFQTEISKRYPNWDLIDSMVVIKERNKTSIWFNPHNKHEHRSLKDFVEFTKIEKPMETHNLELLEQYPNVNIVKGGDWFHGPINLLLNAQQGYNSNQASCTVGFRLALELTPVVIGVLGEDYGVYNKK